MTATPGAATESCGPTALKLAANTSSAPISCGITASACELSAGNSLRRPTAPTAMSPGSVAGNAGDALVARLVDLLRDELGESLAHHADEDQVELAYDALIERGEQIAHPSFRNHLEHMQLRFRSASGDALLGVRGIDDAGAVSAVCQRVLCPAVVGGAGSEVLALRDVVQQRMRGIATRIDDADPHAAPREAPGGRVDAHQTLPPAKQPLLGKIGIELPERAQPDGIDAAAEARRADDAVPVVRCRPDEDRLDRIDGAAEETEARGSVLVRDRLGGQTCRKSADVDHHGRAGERRLALADHPDGHLTRRRPQRQQCPDGHGARGERMTVRARQQAVAFDDESRGRGGPQPLRLAFLDLRYQHLVDAAALGAERQGAAQPQAPHHFDVILTAQVLGHLIHRLRRIAERLTRRAHSRTDQKALTPSATPGRRTAAFATFRAGTLAAGLACSSAR